MRRGALAAAAFAAAATAASAGQATDWSGRVTLYGWFAGIEGDITARNRDAAAGVSLSPGDVLEKLETGVFAFAEARRGRLGLMVDAAYVDLSDAQDVTAPVPGRVSGNTTLTMVTAAASWRVSLHAYAGVAARITDRISAEAGLRYLGFDYEASRVDFDAAMWGPTIGITVNF